MANIEKVRGMLQELVETCRDGQDGYRDAAEHVSDSNLHTFLNDKSLERAGFAGELEQEILILGEKDPDRSGSVTAAVHRAWIDLKATLGGGDAAILKSVEAGEDRARKHYEKVAENPELPDYLGTIVRKQLISIQAAHHHVRSLLDAKAA
jgi:uncharacterized protein (TIGR02284 family)